MKHDKKDDRITLSEGSGGKEMDQLIETFRSVLNKKGNWQELDNDSAIYPLGDERMVFTTDSYTVEPLFFAGGDIGHIAVSGTINDLVMMGARPTGLSLSLIIEEGFSRAQLMRIMQSIGDLSEQTGVPVVTGDTKVMQNGKVDGIIINTSGVGMCRRDEELIGGVKEGDAVILSGGLGEHAVALLSHRFDFETDITTDSKPLLEEMRSIHPYIKLAKDPTRGGIAATLNEISQKYGHQICIYEEDVPMKREVKTVTDMLGLDSYQLACEGRMICVCPHEHANKVVAELKRFNADAAQIGSVQGPGQRVVVQTRIGRRVLPPPTGRIVPRIC